MIKTNKTEKKHKWDPYERRGGETEKREGMKGREGKGKEGRRGKGNPFVQ